MYFHIFHIWIISLLPSAHLFQIRSHMNDYSLAHPKPWSPSPYIDFALANTLGKSFCNVVSICWQDKINIATTITMGKYHGNGPWYPDLHGSDYVRDFFSQDLHMHATLLHRNRIYFLKLHFCHPSVIVLPFLYPYPL